MVQVSQEIDKSQQFVQLFIYSVLKNSKKSTGMSRSIVETLKVFSPDLAKSCPILGNYQIQFNTVAGRNSLFGLLPPGMLFRLDLCVRLEASNTTVGGLFFFELH